MSTCCAFPHVTHFSEAPAVRAAVRVHAGRLVAAGFDANDVQTESEIDLGPVAGADLEERFAHASFVFGAPIAG